MKLILHFLKPHWLLCLFTLFFMIVDVAGALLIPTFAGALLNEGATAGTELSQLLITSLEMALVALFSGVGAILGAYTCASLTSKIGKDMRDAIYKKSLDLSVSDFRGFGTASMTTRMVSDITNIQFALQSTFQMILPVPVIFIVSLVLTFSKDWLMGLILLGVLLLISIIAFFIMRSASPLFRKLQALLDHMSMILLENITGVRVVRAFNNEEKETNRMDESFFDYKETSIKANRLFATLDGMSFFAVNIFILLIYWLSGFRISEGYFGVGDITSIIEYALFALFYLMMAQMTILTLPRALECSNRLKEILDFVPQIKDKENVQKQKLPVLNDVLSFDHVSFRFKDADEYTLKDLHFTCKRGETTAIIGGTGSGKSTLASLILRFNEVTEGSLQLNGVDIRDLSQEQLRDALSYVQQKAWLFTGTIAENLRLGKKDASDEELWHALEVAQASDFVKHQPEGLNTYVAQGGKNFSGGQKQRLCIARALVKKPELYIFDDSLSALDFKTDAALRKALSQETKDVAVVIIAQRVSSIIHAEQIVVLHEGNAVGIGKHEELLKTCPVYKEIYDSQTKEAHSL